MSFSDVSVHIMDGLGGWSLGYGFAAIKSKEDEIAQGESHYLSVIYQISQVVVLGVAIKKVAEVGLQGIAQSNMQTTATVMQLLSVPFLAAAAIVRSNAYPDIAAKINEYIPIVPTELGPWTITVMNFFAEHTGSMVRVGILVTAVALIALGNPIYGSMMLVGLIYEAIDSQGLVPHRVRFYMEKILPHVTNLGLIVADDWFSCIIGGVSIAGDLIPLVPNASACIREKIDSGIHKIFNGISLADCNAPIIEKKQMTYDEIMAVLNDNNEEIYKFNPAHCSKMPMDLSLLPRSEEYDKLMTWFNETNWEERYSLIKGKFIHDKRFLPIIRKHYPNITDEIIKKNFDDFVTNIASEENLTKEQFLANHLKNRMQTLMSQIQGDPGVPIQGSALEFQDALDNCQLIIPYLENTKDPLVREDAVFKLASEAGTYCARAFQNASNELLSEALYQTAFSEKEDYLQEFDPLEFYGWKVRTALQIQRRASIQNSIQAILSKVGAKSISNDIHMNDLYRSALSAGFYPMSKQEAYSFGILEQLQMYSVPMFLLRQKMFQEYSDQIMSIFGLEKSLSCDDMVSEFPLGDFFLHIKNLIDADKSLNDEENENISHLLANGIRGYSRLEHRAAFVRLLYVMLGIYSDQTEFDGREVESDEDKLFDSAIS